MNFRRTFLALLLILLTVPACMAAQERPRLLISQADIAQMSQARPGPAFFEQALREAQNQVDPWLQHIPDIPVPADAGGGYTHEQHKRNSYTILNAGVLYQVTGNDAYLTLVADMLEVYATLYPSLGEHPQKKEQSPGRLFWQSLNEAVWLVTVIQGYDAVYTHLTPAQRDAIEGGLLRPMADFLSHGQPQTFDRVHNHGTWAVAAVGMTGYVLDEPAYVENALFGLEQDGSAGFVKQLDELFSPDGYYSEGPYYQRYALLPFLVFAKAIERNEPQRNIFDHRDGILLKAVHTTIQLSYNGLFFPINDAIKDKGIDTTELVYGVAIAYGMTGDAGLLSIAQRQGRTVLTGDGYQLARALEQGGAAPYPFRSMRLADGSAGDQGALDIFRSGEESGHQAVVFKATAQGMGHGHFDKLSWLFYDNGREIVPDYGAARFLNVESKNGGHYLAENTSWAKQTIAHSTLVVDETSHFGGNWKKGMAHHPVPLYFESGEKLDVAAARMDDAYEDVGFERALVLLKDGPFPRPVVLDVLRASSENGHRYDLPLPFKGHITYVSHPIVASMDSMVPLGEANGYQHLWKRAVSEVDESGLFQLTWLEDNRFYTHSVAVNTSTQFIFTELGANDPEFNLRREQALVQRVDGMNDHVFVSVLEPHGEYNGTLEYTTESASELKSLEHVSLEDGVLIQMTTRNGVVKTIGLSFDAAADSVHRIEYDGSMYEWSGFHHVFEK